MTYDAGSVQPYLVGAEVLVFLHQQPKIKKAFQECILLLARSKKKLIICIPGASIFLFYASDQKWLTTYIENDYFSYKELARASSPLSSMK